MQFKNFNCRTKRSEPATVCCFENSDYMYSYSLTPKRRIGNKAGSVFVFPKRYHKLYALCFGNESYPLPGLCDIDWKQNYLLWKTNNGRHASSILISTNKLPSNLFLSFYVFEKQHFATSVHPTIHRSSDPPIHRSIDLAIQRSSSLSIQGFSDPTINRSISLVIQRSIDLAIHRSTGPSI